MLHRIRQILSDYVPEPLELFPEDPREAAVLIPLTDNNDNPEVILTLRSEHLSSHSGQVAFPGGKQDEEDDDLLVTALRETHEEVGIAPEQVEVLSPLRPMETRFGVKVTPYVGVVAEEIELTLNYDEISSAFRVPLQFLLDTPVGVDEIEYEGHMLYIPRWHYEGYDIWGVTAIILCHFLQVTFDYPMDTGIETALKKAGLL